MAQLIVRRLDDAVKERLRARAKRHGRSLEAEARAILEEATKDEPTDREGVTHVGFGTFMRKRFSKSGLTEEEARLFNEAIERLRHGSKPRDPGFG